MGNVLLIGSPLDRTFKYTCECFQQEHSCFDVLDLNDYYKDGSILDRPSGPLRIAVESRAFDLSDYTSVFVRLAPPPLQSLSDADKASVLSRYCGMRAILQSSSGFIVNPPHQDGGNSSKPFQNWFMGTFGFRVPPSLATNSPEEAAQFIKLHRGEVIYKSMSSVRSKVGSIQSRQTSDLARVKACPVMFQKQIFGTDVRLHVVGEDGFGEEIQVRDTVDYRFSNNRPVCQPITAPDDILAKCILFMRYAKLPFVGFDFKIDNVNGDWVLLEANPSPGYEGYDRRLGGRISRALISILANPPWHGKFHGWPVLPRSSL